MAFEQQHKEWSCGAAALRYALTFLGKSVEERDLRTGVPDHLLGDGRGRDREGRPALRLRGGAPQLPALPGGVPEPDALRAERPTLHPVRRQLDALGRGGRRQPQRRRALRPEGPRGRGARQAGDAAAPLGALPQGGRGDRPAFLLHRHPAPGAAAAPARGRRQRTGRGAAPSRGPARGLGPLPRRRARDLRHAAPRARTTATRSGGSSRAPRRCSSRPSPRGTARPPSGSTARSCATSRSSRARTGCRCGRGTSAAPSSASPAS